MEKSILLVNCIALLIGGLMFTSRFRVYPLDEDLFVHACNFT
jgi:hypothetical protein